MKAVVVHCRAREPENDGVSVMYNENSSFCGFLLPLYCQGAVT